MALKDMWRQTPQELEGRQIEQIIAWAGDGNLRDGSSASNEFREYLDLIPSKLLAEYCERCLDEPFEQSGLALQDLINQLGKRLGFEVEFGRSKATGQRDLDAIIDCAGAPEMMQMGFGLLGIGGHYADVGFIGDRIDIPLFPRVSREQTFHGSFWGNNADLTEVMALAAQDKIRHTTKTIAFEQSNEYLDLLRANQVVGRAVVKF